MYSGNQAVPWLPTPPAHSAECLGRRRRQSNAKSSKKVGYLADEHVHSDGRPRRRTSGRLRSTCRTAVDAGADRPWHSAAAVVMLVGACSNSVRC